MEANDLQLEKVQRRQFWEGHVRAWKQSGLELHRCLRYLFENLPASQSADDYKALLPMYLD